MTTLEQPAVCTLDCPDTCSLTVTVESGRITKVRGSEALPLTAGVICNKVAHHSADFVHGSGRLTTPLKRVGPRGASRFERISWEQALDIIYARVSEVIDTHGPEAVMPLNYAGPHGMLAGDSMSLRFFHKLGASQLYRRSMCGAVRSEAWAGTYGLVPGIGPEVAENAKLTIVWGNNATVANLHLVRKIRMSLRKGGKLVVIDTLRTKIAEQADLHIAPRPSTDVLLAFALAVELNRIGAHSRAFIDQHVLGYEAFMARAEEWPLEMVAAECGIKTEDIRALARWMADADPLVIAPGNGLERGRNGGSGIRAAIALPALMGRLNATSGIVLGASNSFPKTMAKLQRPDLVPAGTRTLNIMDIGRHLTEDDIAPPLRALVIYNHNPVVVHADQNRMLKGLMREDLFLVGIDIAMTESMAFCDIVPGGHALRMRRPLSRIRPSLAAARRGGDPARWRGAAQHRNLPTPGRPLRLRGVLLQGDRPRIDGRSNRRVRPTHAGYPAEPDPCERSAANERCGWSAARALRHGDAGDTLGKG
jgi:anaerobic selenocysteine-containing dehydrogenase